jgi:hypothetical protein
MNLTPVDARMFFPTPLNAGMAGISRLSGPYSVVQLRPIIPPSRSVTR